MGLNNKRKKICWETGSGEMLSLLNEENSDLEDDIDDWINDSGSKFMLEESLENELHSND